MAPTQVRAWIEQLPEPGSQGLSPPSIVYPESSFSQKTTRKLGDVLSSLPSPSPSLSPRPLFSALDHGAEPGQDGSRKRRRLDERANAPSTRRQAVTNVAVANCVQKRREINPVPASTSRTLPASSSGQRSNATPVQDAGTVVQLSDRETPYRSISRPYRADEMMPSIEDDSGSNSVMLTPACRVKSHQDPIDINSIPSSTSEQSASFATAQQTQQAQDARISRSRHATFTWNSSSLTPGSNLIASSPCIRHRQRLRTLRQPAVSAVTSVPARSLSTPSSIVRQMNEPFQQRRRITSEEGPRAATFTSAEAVSCNILNSTESDMPVTATDSVSSRQREARLDELVLPSIETVDYDTHHSTSEHQMTGVGRCSFNNKHLELLSSDDRSRLRHRLRARQGERSSSHPGRVSTEHTRQFQSQHVSRRNSLVASFSDEIEQTLSDRGIESNVHRATAVSSPIHDRFKAFIDRVQSLSVCKGIFPEELGPELQAETGLRLLHPNDQHGFMLERSSRLGFRPNTAFRADFLGADGQFPDATLLTVRDSPTHPGPQAALKTELSWEFEALKDLVQASRQCSDVSSNDCGGGPSNSWASKVYTPLLDLATRYATTTSTTSCATPESGTDGDVDSAGNIVRTSVRVSQTAMAQMHSRPVSGGSQAYAFVVTPRPHDELDSKLRLRSSKFAHEVESDHLSRRLDHNMRSDEHDAIVSSAHHPIGAIFLELRRRCRHSQCGAAALPDLSLTLPSLPPRTCTRLAGWVDAWRAHICQIVDHDEHRKVTSAMPCGSRQAKPRVMPNDPHHVHACKTAPLPVVAMDEADWYLLFIEKDCGLKQDQQPVRIGSTDSIVEAYKLLATLREVTHWVGCDFRQWLEDVL
ncbi:hypothetical protein SUNI508_13365 [Seiridium unicorne]|uniref:PD-(D/E)XK nuclease-like domain-containing protein n=1 Tax=Seiridium unicorne TaxID=138068 RepID=A0ABR2VDA8_9PEZI